MERFLKYCEKYALDPYLVLSNIPYFINYEAWSYYKRYRSGMHKGDQFILEMYPNGQKDFITFKDNIIKEDFAAQFKAYKIFKAAELDLLDTGDQIKIEFPKNRIN
ncbi:hypothetical protein SAMN03097699_3168 [Flavobacteriaceae bacterium MAR_2010_188]|nr:hypothetical protein SAMN03097699_3168 [Flavobacteriaceae bacterium MAR_2010_188]